MKVDEGDDFECCEVGIVYFVVKVVDVYWLSNQVVGQICGCQRYDQQIQIFLKFCILQNCYYYQKSYVSVKNIEKCVSNDKENNFC